MEVPPPSDIRPSRLAEVLAAGWGIEALELTYVPKGAGSYHWSAAGWFVTLDDLRTKPWLGPHPDEVFTGLVSAYGTAALLAESAGLDFVVAPVRSLEGSAAVRLAEHYSLAVFPLLDGRAGRWGEPIGASERERLLGRVAELHLATPSVLQLAPRRTLRLPARESLESALAELGVPWDAGPFAEPARVLLRSRAAEFAGWLEEYDRRVAVVSDRSAAPVVTHGETHPGNLIWAATSPRLVDWDTVALAPAERDLWMLDDGTPSAWAAYEAATGCSPDPVALSLYRLAWALTDLGLFLAELRRPHGDDPAIERTWQTLSEWLSGRSVGPYGPGWPVPGL